jgi:hypothetical protein
MRPFMMFALCLSLAAQGPAKKPAPDGALLAVSEGGGTVRLLVWQPMKTPPPPGGWQVQDAGGKSLGPIMRAGDPEAAKALTPEEAQEGVRLQLEVQKEPDLGKRRMMALNALVSAGNRQDLGRVMGIGCSLGSQPAGHHAYSVVGLDASGNAIGPRLTSSEIDPSQASPVPKVPGELRAEATKEAVRLYWKPVDGGEIPVVDYRVQRGDQVLTQRPNILGIWDPAKPVFEDREAPGDQASEYRVYAMDVFGRRGPDTVAGVFFPDPATLRPPASLTVRSEGGANLLAFKPSPTKRSAGILVERAMTPMGPFELASPKPLAADAGSFRDASVGGGATYYYRLRAVDAEGNVGDPGATTYVIAQSAGRPAAPAGFEVKASPLGNLLTWTLPETPIAGFLVERRLGEGVWTRLGSELAHGARYEDLLTDDVSGVISYRLSAITFDNLQSDPCEPVNVLRENLAAPETPVIQGVDGADGKVVLHFRPAGQEERTAQFLVLRAIRRTEEQGAERFGVELVVGDPLPATAREFIDSWVDPGETYRYRLVAVSPEGVRSALATGVETRVSPPPVPEPPAPVLTFTETPFRHVKAALAAIPEGFRAYLHRKAPGESVWTEVQGPFQVMEVVDPRPAMGRVQYRLHFEDSKGLTGRSGPSATIEIK